MVVLVRGCARPVRMAPIPAMTTEDDADGGGHVGYLSEYEQASQDSDRGFQAHQGAEHLGGESAQGEVLEAERQHGMERGQRQHDEEGMPRRSAQL